jgi:hypothetical protein
LVVLEERFAWTGEAWQVTRQTINEYDEVGRLTDSELQNFNQDDEVWNTSWRTFIEYNDADLVDEWINQSWFAEAWHNSGRRPFSYDAANNTTAGNYYYLSNNSSEWIVE